MQIKVLSPRFEILSKFEGTNALAIDFGGSFIKIIRNNGPKSPSYYRICKSDFDDLIKIMSCKPERITNLIVSGGGSCRNMEKFSLCCRNITTLDEIQALVKGLCLAHSVNYPVLLVNIGSGVSMIKVESECDFQRIGGTALGGGSFTGLSRLILRSRKSFSELINMAKSGQASKVDLTVGDIYGRSYPEVGLEASDPASYFGKLRKDATPNDYIFCLLNLVCSAIMESAILHASIHKIDMLVFSGTFVNNDFVRYIFNSYRLGERRVFFVEKAAYLAALGAYVACPKAI